MTQQATPTVNNSSKTASDSPLLRPRRTLTVVLALAGLLAVAAFVFRGTLLANWDVRTAEVAIEEGRLPDAEAALQRALQHQPDNLATVLLMCRVLRFQGRISESAQVLEQARGLGCSAQRLRQESILNAARLGRLDAAESYLSQLLADDTIDSRDVCESYVVGFRQQGRFQEAELLLNAWEADWPEDNRIIGHRGIIAQMQGQWATAIELYETAVRNGDRRIAMQRRLGECFLETRNAKRAVEIFEQCVAADPANAETWLSLAKSYLLSGNESSAMQAIESCLEQDPWSFDAKLAKAKIHLSHGDNEAAEILLKELLVQWPDDAAALYEYGQTLARLGRTAEGEAVLERWKMADAQLELIEELVVDLAAEPLDIPLRLKIGKLVMEHYSRRMGLQYLMLVLQMDPGNREAHELLIRYHKSRGESEDAARLRRALRAEPGPSTVEGSRP
jgi:predicted Zn-dependent protease